MNLFDSHAHYNDEQFDKDREEIIKKTLCSGVSNFIVAGYNLESSKKAIEIVKKYEQAFAIVGISPNDLENIKTKEDIEKNIKNIKDILKKEFMEPPQLQNHKKDFETRRIMPNTTK